MDNTALDQNPVSLLVHELCSIPSDVDLKTNPPRTEEALARHTFNMLRQHEWLQVELQELQPGRFNVLAMDCAPEDISLLIIGHLDTVPMSVGWTVEPGTFKDGKYYNLGAGDTKGGIAAALDAIPSVGPTKGVGYLFYCDEEYHFLGMTEFLRSYPQIKPKSALSVCGTPESLMIGCRGLIELEITLKGVSGHASRQDVGCNAIQTLTMLVDDLRGFCSSFVKNESDTPTAFNLAAITGGCQTQGTKQENGPPALIIPANEVHIQTSLGALARLIVDKDWLKSHNLSELTSPNRQNFHFTPHHSDAQEAIKLLHRQESDLMEISNKSYPDVKFIKIKD